MKHCGTQRIETDRLILRRFEAEDYAAMFKNWASDNEVTKYLTWQTHKSSDESAGIINEWIGAYSDKRFYNWAIVPKAADEPIGNISVVQMSKDTSTVQIGYCIGKAWWHRGITPEALSAVIDYLFSNTDVTRIEAMHDARNPDSGMVMKKCGMKYEGTVHSSARNNQGICDACYYSLLRNER